MNRLMIFGVLNASDVAFVLAVFWAITAVLIIEGEENFRYALRMDKKRALRGVLVLFSRISDVRRTAFAAFYYVMIFAIHLNCLSESKNHNC